MDNILNKIVENPELVSEKPVKSYSFWYKSDGVRVKGFLSLPNIDITRNHFPVVIVNRGGTGDFGKIDESFLKHLGFLPLNGYVTIFSQYRGNDGGEGVDKMGGEDINDVLNLYGILQHLPFVDLNRIGMWGVSRGGMMTLQALSKVDWIKTAVIIAPIVDEFNMAVWRPGWKEHQEEVYGGSDDEKYKRSPIYWVDKISSVPMLFFHGLKDDRTNPRKTIELADKLKDRGVYVETEILSKEGHLIAGKTVQRTIDWFSKYL